MGSLKKLAGQTAWYGISSIAARFINYLLTPYLTYKLSSASYGDMSLLYSAIPFLNVVFTYGMETAYFRFSNKDHNESDIYNTAGFSLIMSTIFLTGVLFLFRGTLARVLSMEAHPEFITWSIVVIAIDTFTALPFARLRNQNRPRKYAAIRVINILVNIGVTYFFYSVLPGIAEKSPASFLAKFYDPNLGAGYYVIAGIISSSSSFILLLPEFLSIRIKWNRELWIQMIIYSLPIMIAGFGGMINETFDRIMLGWWAPVATEEARKVEVGIYSACYKLSLLITLFVQAFKMGAEPFFFQQSKGENAPRTYARVMKFFVIAICCMFLFVMLYIDIWREFIRNKAMWAGLGVVPILLIANMCLGVYYNLSIWYKLSHNTRAGATITIIGAGITLLINFTFIPYFSYMACAWATLACYASMMVISYFWGQRVYHVPYSTKKLLGYFGVMLVFYFINYGVRVLTPTPMYRYPVATLLLFLYLRFVFEIEKKEFARIPFLNKLVRSKGG